MSNQAHKNRTSPQKFHYGSASFSNPVGAAGKRIQFERARLKRQAAGDATRAEKSSELNPSGRAKFKGYSSYSEPMGVARISEKKIQALPDPSASSRGANVRANKERGTQSSTQRKVIK